MKKRIVLYVVTIVIGLILGCNRFNKVVREETYELAREYKKQLETSSSEFIYHDEICAIPNKELFEFTVDKDRIFKLNFFTVTDNIEKFVEFKALDKSEEVLESNFKRTFLFEVRELDNEFEVSKAEIPYIFDFDDFKLAGAGTYDLSDVLLEPQNNNNVVDFKLKQLEEYKTWEITGEFPLKWDTIKKYVKETDKEELELDVDKMLEDYVKDADKALKNDSIDKNATIELLKTTHKRNGVIGDFTPVFK